MSDPREFHFHIDALQPSTVPMERLAQYLLELSKLFGRQEHVHFDRLEEGSLSIYQLVDEDALTDVRFRLNAVNDSSFEDVRKAFGTLNSMLAKDCATATLVEVGAGKVIPFPGKNQVPVQTYRISQPGNIEGQLIRIGGKDATSHLTLQEINGETHSCVVTRELAKELAPHLYGSILRLLGEGVWIRDTEGCWSLDKFKASSYEVLRHGDLTSELDALVAIDGCAWHEIDDVSQIVFEERGDQ